MIPKSFHGDRREREIQTAKEDEREVEIESDKERKR